MKITGRNVNEVLQEACWNIDVSGIQEHTRNGPVRSIPHPVLVKYQKPMERVLLWPERKCNPFFHFFEALWMLAGRWDVAYVTQFNKRMAEYSDDGMSFHGAYGRRWRDTDAGDQIKKVVELLRKDPETRRAVITAWNAYEDLGSASKDLPCNTHIYFRNVDGRLDMTVCNRSNDLIWGMCGSNAVHFSMMHEIVSHGAGLLMGYYYHFTNNLHIYDEIANRQIYRRPTIVDQYVTPNGVTCRPMITVNLNQWLHDCERFVNSEEPIDEFYYDPWWGDVVIPMWLAWKEGNLTHLDNCLAEDWRRAGQIYFAGKNVVSVV
jgi:thymidylate synthase